MKLRIEIDPLPCPRPRIMARGKFAHAYYPKSYKDWKELFAKQFDSHPPLEGALRVAAEFHCTRPRTSKLTHPSPDIDNYLKALMDALTQVGAWHDDKQVVEVSAIKRWTAGGGYILLSISEAP